MYKDFISFFHCLVKQNKNISLKENITYNDINFVLCSSYLIKNLYLLDKTNKKMEKLYFDNLLIASSILHCDFEL